MPTDLELSLLQTVRLKGRPSSADIAAATGAPEPEVEAALEQLVALGHLIDAGDRFRLSPDGKDALAAALREERSRLDAEAMREIYEDFTPINADFKRTVTDWQQRDGAPNDHSDAGYDTSVLERLDDIDARFEAVRHHAYATVPRLRSYEPRFTGALHKLRAGDHAWFLRPIIDSYHTVWFEFHEELIELAGLSRAEEAAAGRAE